LRHDLLGLLVIDDAPEFRPVSIQDRGAASSIDAAFEHGTPLRSTRKRYPRIMNVRPE
jgi:hypothetical protein